MSEASGMKEKDSCAASSAFTDIRNFIYIDTKKLRSLSSQVFEGVTEYLVMRQNEGVTEENTQKGKPGSGRLMADLLSQSSETERKAFLDDYSYILFENELTDRGMVVSDNWDEVSVGQIIRVEGRIMLSDIENLNRLLVNYNDIGLALHITQVLSFSGDMPAGKAGDSKLRQDAKAIGLQSNKRFTDALSKLFEFGYSDLLEVRLAAGGKVFRAPLKREGLKEDHDLTVTKYSRMTEQKFFMVGIITQSAEVDDPPEFCEEGGESMSNAIVGLNKAARGIEGHFSARQENEIIVEPIAVYSELNRD